MTTVYRAYSPSRDDHGKVHTDEDRAAETSNEQAGGRAVYRHIYFGGEVL